MIVRFDTWERAGIFAGRMRAEGRAAEILDGGVCFLWGPLAMGGVRVAVSDIVLDEDGEWPEVKPADSELANLMRSLVVAFALAGPIFLWIAKASESSRNMDRHSMESIELLVIIISIAGCAAAFAVAGPAMPAFTRFLRDDDSPASGFVRVIVVFLMIVIFLLL